MPETSFSFSVLFSPVSEPGSLLLSNCFTSTCMWESHVAAQTHYHATTRHPNFRFGCMQGKHRSAWLSCKSNTACHSNTRTNCVCVCVCASWHSSFFLASIRFRELYVNLNMTGTPKQVSLSVWFPVVQHPAGGGGKNPSMTLTNVSGVQQTSS